MNKKNIRNPEKIVDLISIEKSFDKRLKDGRDKLMLTLDKNLQFIIRNELLNAQKIFKNIRRHAFQYAWSAEPG